MQRIAWTYRIEREVQRLSVTERLAVRQGRSKPLWEEMHVWQQPAGRQRARRQQPLRKPDASLGSWQKVVIIRGQRAGRPTRRRRHKPGGVGEVERPRSLGLPQGCAHTAANAAERPHRRVAAAILDAASLTSISSVGDRRDATAERLPASSSPADADFGLAEPAESCTFGSPARELRFQACPSQFTQGASPYVGCSTDACPRNDYTSDIEVEHSTTRHRTR